MDLDDLDDLIFGLGIDPTPEELNELYERFEIDFRQEPLHLLGLQIKVIEHHSTIEEFQGYPETFVHLITRKSKSGHRVFDRLRANRIHWIRVILENREDERILYFQHREAKGSLRDYYWYEERNFMVVMEQITPNYLIITCFVIDSDRNQQFYKKRYNEFKSFG